MLICSGSSISNPSLITSPTPAPQITASIALVPVSLTVSSCWRISEKRKRELKGKLQPKLDLHCTHTVSSCLFLPFGKSSHFIKWKNLTIQRTPKEDNRFGNLRKESKEISLALYGTSQIAKFEPLSKQLLAQMNYPGRSSPLHPESLTHHLAYSCPTDHSPCWPCPI